MEDLEIRIETARKRLNELNFESLSEIDKVLITVYELEAEVNNGGFDQYYFNSSGNLAYYAPQALKIIGAPKMARIVADANQKFGINGPPRDWDERQEKLEIITEDEDQWEELDSEFYSYPEDIEKLLAEYIGKNPN